MVAALEPRPQGSNSLAWGFLLLGFVAMAVLLEEGCCFVTIGATDIGVIILWLLCRLKAGVHCTFKVAADQSLCWPVSA